MCALSGSVDTEFSRNTITQKSQYVHDSAI